MLSELQKMLVEGTRGDAYDAGELRRRQVVIGAEGAPIERSRFVPPPPEELPEGVSKWEQWVHSDAETHLLVRVCLGHYRFETLHPFSDGNGRLGRLIVALQLIEGGALRYPLLNIAEWLEQRKDEYQNNLLKLSTDGDFSSWIRFFASGVNAAAEASLARIDRLLDVRQSLLDRIRAAGSRGGIGLRIVEELIGYPIIDVPYIANRYNVSFQAANQAVARLEALGILRELKERKQKRRIFYAPDVLRGLAGYKGELD